jgi:hypothetical protein
VLGTKAAEVAVLLAQGTALDAIPGATIFTDGPREIPMHSILLAPIPITRDNLNIVIDAGWVSREVVCHGVDAASATARLNAGVTSTGMLAELHVIAAAVIGGTSLGGGVGTVVGALIGAVFMQSLQNGMVVLGMIILGQQPASLRA